MELDGTQQKQLRDALLSAFPKHEHLEMMVSDGMGEYLATITGSSNLQYATYELICWAQARGRLEELILAARKENSCNTKLQSIAQQFGLDKDHKDGLTSDSIHSQTASRDNRSTRKTTSGSTELPPPSAERASTEEYDVFISYRQRDRDWVSKQLVSRLRQTGLTVCVDYDSDPFRPGFPVVRAIERAITRSRKTVLVLSPQYLQGTWTEFEDILVQTIGITTSRPRLIPLLYQPCDESTIPWRIKSLIWLDFTQPVNTESQFKRLVAAIRDEAPPIEQSETKKSYQPAFSPRNLKRTLAVGAGPSPCIGYLAHPFEKKAVWACIASLFLPVS